MEEEITLRDIVQVLKRKKYVILLTTLLAVFLAAVYAFLIAKKVYESYAVVGVNPQNIKARLESKIELQPANLITADTLKTILFSQEVLTKIAEKAKGLSDIPENWKQKSAFELANDLRGLFNLKVAAPQRLDTMDARGTIIPATLTSKASKPELAAKLANFWAEIGVQAINRLLSAQIQANLTAITRQLPEAEHAFRQAQLDWEEFQRKTNLASMKKELSYRVAQKVEIAKELEKIQQSIWERQKQLETIRDKMKMEATRYGGRVDEITLIFAGSDLKSALRELKKREQEAETDYRQKRKELDRLKRAVPFGEWKALLSKYQLRLASIQVRLKEIATQKEILKGRLANVKRQLNQTPQLMVLKREITSEPVALALKQRASDLSGLILENESLNPLYKDLESQNSNLESELAALSQEEKALIKEESVLRAKEQELRAKLTDATSKLDFLDMQVTTAQKHYQALHSLYARYAGLEKTATFEPSQPRYQTLKSKELATELELAVLKARKESFSNWQKENEERLMQLKALVAQDELRANRLQENLRLSKETYLALKQKQTDLKIELASVEGSFAQIISPAYPDPNPVSPQKALILALSTLLGLMVGLFWAFVSAALEEPAETTRSETA